MQVIDYVTRYVQRARGQLYLITLLETEQKKTSANCSFMMWAKTVREVLLMVF